MKAFLQREKMIVKNKAISSQEVDERQLDDKTPVRNNLAKLDDIYPEFRASLEDYSKSIIKLHTLAKSRNFGQDLLDENDVMRNQINRIRFNADQIILNTVPIIIFLQYELDNAIGSLSG